MRSTSVKNQTPEKGVPRGAVQSRTGFIERLRSYWAHHRGSFTESLVRLISTPIQTLMTSAVVAIALALPVTLLLAMDNVDQLGASWDANPKISVYLNPRAKTVAITQLVSTVESYEDVESVMYLSPEDALADFQKFSGFGSALEALDQNPLPPTLVVSPSISAMGPERLAELGKQLGAEPIVDDVSLDMNWVRRLQEIMLLGKKIVMALATLLGIGVLLAIGNTIRLAIENRREEILVTKLVGGTDGFVRRPFLYSGGWYGLFGGILASIIVLIAYTSISPSVQRLAALYQSEFTLQGLGPALIFKLLALATMLGWVGAWIAVSRHLRLIEPR